MNVGGERSDRVVVGDVECAMFGDDATECPGVGDGRLEAFGVTVGQIELGPVSGQLQCRRPPDPAGGAGE